MKDKKFLKKIIFAAALLAIILTVPIVLKGYSMRVINVAVIFGIVAYGISVMLGMGGQMSFASVSFMGAGAYFAANMCTGRLGINMPALGALLLTPIVFAAVGYVIGLVLFKLSGTYFTFATIALVQVAYTFYNNFKPLFGGADGISGIPALSLFGFELRTTNQWFYIIAAFAVITALIVERIRKTQLGRSLASIRDNETAALTLGVNTYKTKVIAFSIAAALSAFAGALWCFHGKFVGADMFNYANAAQFVIMAMLGGVNSTAGVMVGSVLVNILPEVLRSLQNYMQLFWGIAIIVLMVFMPEGLAGLLGRLKEKAGRKKSDKKEDKEGAESAANS